MRASLNIAGTGAASLRRQHFYSKIMPSKVLLPGITSRCWQGPWFPKECNENGSPSTPSTALSRRAARGASASPAKQGSDHTHLRCPVRYEATINLQVLTFVLFLLVTLLFVDGRFVHINIFLIATCNQREKWTLYPPAAFRLLSFSTKTDVKSVSAEYILGIAYWLRPCAEKPPSNNKKQKN